MRLRIARALDLALIAAALVLSCLDRIHVAFVLALAGYVVHDWVLRHRMLEEWERARAR